MDDPRPDAPELELTLPVEGAVGPDALQLGPADAPAAPAADLGDAFSMHLATPEPQPIERGPPPRSAKPVTLAANDSVVAALMGRPIGKPAASAPQPNAEPAEPVSVGIAAAVVTEETTAAVVAFLAPLADADSSAAPGPTPAVLSGVPVFPAAPAVQPAAQPAFRPHTPPAPSRVGRGPLVVNGPKHPAGRVDRAPAFRSAIPVAPAWPAASSAPPAPDATPDRPPRLAGPERGPRLSAQGATASSARSQSLGDDSARPSGVPAKLRPAAPGQPPAAPVAPTPTADVPAATPRPQGPTGAWWTIPLTFVGIAIVACAILIPAADENRRDLYELARIERDVDYFERQSAVNEDFLTRVNTDATLVERLAQRQLHQTRQGVRLAPIASHPDRFGASPYAMTRLDPPAPLPAYRPTPGRLSEWFLGDKRPQQMSGLGLCLAGAGVLLGGLRKKAV